jgi:hypothetical protein
LIVVWIAVKAVSELWQLAHAVGTGEWENAACAHVRPMFAGLLWQLAQSAVVVE